MTSHTLADGRIVHISDQQAFYRLPGSYQLISTTPRKAIRMIATNNSKETQA